MSADGSTKLQPSTDVGHYQKDLPEISKPARRILETYSGISAEDIASHLHEVVCAPRQDGALTLWLTDLSSERARGKSSPTHQSETGTSSTSASSTNPATPRSSFAYSKVKDSST